MKLFVLCVCYDVMKIVYSNVAVNFQHLYNLIYHKICTITCECSWDHLLNCENNNQNYLKKKSVIFFKNCIKIYIFSPFLLLIGGDFMTNFFMVPNEVFDLNLKPQQFAVLCYILKCCDESNTCYPSIHTIAEACAISDNTFRESIKFLCKRKIITKSGGFTVGKYVLHYRKTIFTNRERLAQSKSRE